jgi:hypothetical protein
MHEDLFDDCTTEGGLIEKRSPESTQVTRLCRGPGSSKFDIGNTLYVFVCQRGIAADDAIELTHGPKTWPMSVYILGQAGTVVL